MRRHRARSRPVALAVLVTVSTEPHRLLTRLAFSSRLRSQSGGGDGGGQGVGAWSGASRWRFRHSPRAARSCRSSAGRRGPRGRSGTAGTPASAAVSGRGCSALASCWGERSCVFITVFFTKSKQYFLNFHLRKICNLQVFPLNRVTDRSCNSRGNLVQ